LALSFVLELPRWDCRRVTDLGRWAKPEGAAGRESYDGSAGRRGGRAYVRVVLAAAVVGILTELAL